MNEHVEDFEGVHCVGYMEGRKDPCLSIACPKPGCGAGVGMRCWNWNHQRTRDQAHAERRLASKLDHEAANGR